MKCTFSPSLALHYQLPALIAMWWSYSDATPWRLNTSDLEKESGQSSRYSLLFEALISTQHLPLQEVLASPYISALVRSFPLKVWFATLSPTSAQLLFLDEGSTSHWH